MCDTKNLQKDFIDLLVMPNRLCETVGYSYKPCPLPQRLLLEVISSMELYACWEPREINSNLKKNLK